MTAGLLVATVRSTLLDALQDRPGLAEVVVAYEAPRGHFARDDGRGGLQIDTAERPIAIWFDAEVIGELEPSYGMKGLPYKTKETWSQTVVVQVLPRNIDDDQGSMEALLADLVGELVAALAPDPTMGIVLDSGRVDVIPASFKWIAGPFGDRGSGARCEVVLSVEADRC